MNIYGVLNIDNCHTDITTSVKGAKRFATNNGYDKVSRRNSDHYYVEIMFVKVAGKWKRYEYDPDTDN